ncbi:hypothetical protein [Massilia sp. TS11]|uniref:hypothetical protein n=1 Tax=Massilia sp. TS11 TaxID=2908003 RepID=UPI001EDAC93F|nr:hypothetical protein [Massilia sp. TS11]MCG2584966.1 hypothetical protein [Massilia sp. TS11]
MLGQPGFHAEVIEDVREPGTPLLAGLCVAVVLDARWEALLAKAPPAEASALLYQELASGAFTPPGPQEIAERNSHGRISLFILHNRCVLEEYQDASHDRLLRGATQGFHLQRLFQEGRGEDLQLRRQGWQPQPARQGLQLFSMSRLLAASLPAHSVLAEAFHYGAPRLGMGPAEQRTLRLAVAGIGDVQIAAELGVTERSVLRAWQAVSQRICTRLPQLCNGHPCAGVPGQLHPAARAALMNYLLDHPEELRPYLHQDASTAGCEVLLQWPRARVMELPPALRPKR